MPIHAHGASEAVQKVVHPADYLTGSELHLLHSLLPFKAQTHLESQTHLLSSENGTERVLRLAHRASGPFGCTHPEDGSRAEAARRGKPSLCHCGLGGPTGEAKIVKARLGRRTLNIFYFVLNNPKS